MCPSKEFFHSSLQSNFEFVEAKFRKVLNDDEIVADTVLCRYSCAYKTSTWSISKIARVCTNFSRREMLITRVITLTRKFFSFLRKTADVHHNHTVFLVILSFPALSSISLSLNLLSTAAQRPYAVKYQFLSKFVNTSPHGKVFGWTRFLTNEVNVVYLYSEHAGLIYETRRCNLFTTAYHVNGVSEYRAIQ